MTGVQTCALPISNVDVELPTDLESGDKVEITFYYKGKIEYIDKI